MEPKDDIIDALTFAYSGNNYKIRYKDYSDTVKIQTDEEKLDGMDFKTIEAYVRKKKLENINNK